MRVTIDTLVARRLGVSVRFCREFNQILHRPGSVKATYCEWVNDHEPPAFVLLPDSEESGTGEFGPFRTEESGSVPFSRRLRVLAAVVALVLAASGVLLQRHRAADAVQAARLASLRSIATTPSPTPTANVLADQRPWPTVPGPCGESALLPIVHTAPLTERTGIRLLVGGSGPAEVDLDHGSVTPTADLDLPSGTFVLDQQPLSSTVLYLTTATCSSGADVIRVAAGQRAVTVFSQPFSVQLFPDGTGGIWTSRLDTAGTALGDGQFQIDLVRLDEPKQVPLPVGYQPIAVHANLAVAAAVQVNSTEQKLVLYDLTRRRIVRDLGLVQSYAQSQGELLWLTWPCESGTPCPLHSYDLTTGTESEHGYSLPTGTDLTGSELSNDHGRLVFTLSRSAEDPRYYGGTGGAPGDLMVLNLASDVLESVPNLELPPGAGVSTTFSQDGTWLIIAMNLTHGPQLLLWRSGLASPLVSAAKLTGPVQDPLLVRLSG
jgi:hypothetical protein